MKFFAELSFHTTFSLFRLTRLTLILETAETSACTNQRIYWMNLLCDNELFVTIHSDEMHTLFMMNYVCVIAPKPV